MGYFLPISKNDMIERGIEQLDFIIITGDSYVDHPSFGTAIIGRVIEACGHTVGIISQPDFHNAKSVTSLGRPKYAFLINSGNIDSMVAHYTAAKRKRSDDAYTAGGKAGKRPDRAVTVYCKMVRQVYGDIPIVIGGLEASLRRFAHYDYWSETVMESILADSTADLLVYGMGEKQTIEITNRLAAGEDFKDLIDIRGTCYLTKPENTPWGAVQCPDFKTVAGNKESYAKSVKLQIREQDDVRGKTVIQRQKQFMLVQNPPMQVLNTDELDWVYKLPFQRRPHPVYDSIGKIPGFSEIEFSVTHNRGCFGGCNFCAIALHQGRKVSIRSEESVLDEVKEFTKSKDFKGYVNDVGGPTANFRIMSCKKQDKSGLCADRKCLAPKPCKNLDVDHSDYLNLLRKIREIDGVKKVFIRSGIRYDYLLEDKNCDEFLDELVRHYVSGQLRVAPEHTVNKVLDAMGKPHIESYLKFSDKFYKKTKEVGKEQYLVPYLISSHPGCDLNSAIDLAVFLKKENIHPDQVQDFYPTPGTVSTCMYYTGIDPMTGEKIYVPKSKEEKAMQRALLQYFLPQNRELVEKALRQAKRYELIGNSKNCLVQGTVHQKQVLKGNNKWQQKGNTERNRRRKH